MSSNFILLLSTRTSTLLVDTGYVCQPSTIRLLSQVVGLSLSQAVDDLALLYLATIQALAVSRKRFTLPTISSKSRCFRLMRLCACFLVASSAFVLVPARYSSHSRGHERRRAWNHDPFPVRRFEQKRNVCADSHQRHRYKLYSFDIVITNILEKVKPSMLMTFSTIASVRTSCSVTRPDGGRVSRSSGSGCMCISGLQQHTGGVNTHRLQNSDRI